MYLFTDIENCVEYTNVRIPDINNRRSFANFMQRYDNERRTVFKTI